MKKKIFFLGISSSHNEHMNNSAFAHCWSPHCAKLSNYAWLFCFFFFFFISFFEHQFINNLLERRRGEYPGPTDQVFAFPHFIVVVFMPLHRKKREEKRLKLIFMFLIKNNGQAEREGKLDKNKPTKIDRTWLLLKINFARVEL